MVYVNIPPVIWGKGLSEGKSKHKNYFDDGTNLNYLRQYVQTLDSVKRDHLISEYYNIAKNLLRHPWFSKYPKHVQDDMVSFAMEKCLEIGNNKKNENYGIPRLFRYDVFSNTSLFSYWTQCVKNSFRSFLNKYYEIKNTEFSCDNMSECEFNILRRADMTNVDLMMLDMLEKKLEELELKQLKTDNPRTMTAIHEDIVVLRDKIKIVRNKIYGDK